MSVDRKRPATHAPPAEDGEVGATVNFSADASGPSAPQTLLDVPLQLPDEVRNAPLRRPARAAVQEPEPAPDDGVAPTSNFSARAAAPQVHRLQGPLARFVALPRLVRAGVVVGMGLVVAGVGLVLFSGGEKVVQHADAPPPSKRTAELAAQAKAAFATGQFAAAATAWQGVLDLDSSNAEAQRELANARTAMAGQGVLDQARAALDAKKYDDARAVLRGVAADSPLAGPARALWTQVDHAQAAELFAKGEDQLHKKDLAGAKATVDKLKALDDTFYGKLSLELDTATDAKH